MTSLPFVTTQRSRPPVSSTRALLALSVACGSGCAKMPQGRPVVDAVRVQGAKQVDAEEVEEKIATSASPKFLMLFQGVIYDYSPYNQGTLDTDLERVERLYRARGYYDVKARGGRVVETKPGHVDITISVQEGAPTPVRQILLNGIDGLPPTVQRAARRASLGLPVGKPFDEEKYAATGAAIIKALTDRGYAFAKVTRSADVDLARRAADVTYDLVPGRVAVFGEVRVEGLGTLPERPVRRALDLRKGALYSTAVLDDARTSVLDLGVFSNVDIQPDLSDSEAEVPVVPLLVTVEPTKVRAIRIGGGVELDLIRTDVHLAFGWEHANFLGGLRRLTIDFRPGLVFYPTRLPTFQPPTNYLPEEKTRIELSQPGFIEARTSGKIAVEYNIFPVLLSPKVDPKATVIGYRELKSKLALDRTFWKLYGEVAYNFQQNTPFAYVRTLDPALGGVTISYVSLLTQLDFRNDKIRPHKGAFFSNDLQVAGGPFFGDATDVRTQPEARVYLPTSKRTTVALRGSVGFLFPFNYADTLSTNAAVGRAPAGTDRKSFVDDVQLVYFRAFFSGGPSSNRGYALRGVGPHGNIPFFNPALAALALQNSCDPQGPDFNAARCAQPLGGLSLWELSTEFRFPVRGALSSALFCDASDVSPKRVTIRPTYLHLSCGTGLRYDTPVGPVRLDVGYRIPGMQIIGKPDTAVEGNPGTVFGVPIAVSLGIGEAF